MDAVPTSALPAPAAILLALDRHTIRGAMRKLHDQLARHPAVQDHDELWRAFEERLVLGANCLSEAIAIPHVRSRTVSEIVFAVGRSLAGVEVDETHPSVQLVFLVAAPPDQVNEYLELMAALTRRLKNPGTLAALLTAGSEEYFRGILIGPPPFLPRTAINAQTDDPFAPRSAGLPSSSCRLRRGTSSAGAPKPDA